MTRGLITFLAMTAPGLAFAESDCGFLGACPVPELDGGMAVLALGLTAAVVAIVRERLRRR
jgi:hypothetical protein